MTNSGESFQIPTTSYHLPPGDDDPLLNLSNLRSKMDTLHHFLSHTLSTNTLLSPPHLLSISGEISATLRHVIINAAALLPSTPTYPSSAFWPEKMSNSPLMDSTENGSSETKLQVEKAKEVIFINDWDIVELDSVELLTEHVHFCDICGKGFKRDANLRMHMRAHGFKSPGALSKPVEINKVGDNTNTRFSCPYIGCCRNKGHGKFRPLKSAICAKNHFKRSHCPKMYTCNRCNKKSFSVLADLKSHLKHCGEAKWKCSCGTTFSRKDKLFGHLTLFEGHMPAVREEGERERRSVVVIDDDDENENKEGEKGGSFLDDGFFDGLIDGFGDTSNGNNLQCVLGMGSPSGVGNSMDELFEF